MNKEFYDEQLYLRWEQLNTKTLENNKKSQSAHKKLTEWSTYIYQDPNYIGKQIDHFIDNASIFHCYGFSDTNGKEFFLGTAIITPPYRKGNKAIIDYIIVDPRKQSKGYGSMMFTSIVNHPEFFVGQRHTTGFQGIIDSDNVPAIMASIKSGKFNTAPYNNPIVEGIRKHKEEEKAMLEGRNPDTSNIAPTHVRIYTDESMDY